MKKQKKSSGKLELHRETLRTLEEMSEEDLKEAHGGAVPTRQPSICWLC